jgi:hypothetical protein
MATVATQTVTSSGLEATANAADVAGDRVTPGSILRVVNGSGASIDLTMVTPQLIDGDLTVQDRVVSVPTGEARYVRASSVYRDPSDGLVGLEWSDVTSVTFEVIT